jgi:MarR family transcriptional regulator, organic hydroperoxide resistance regulator
MPDDDLDLRQQVCFALYSASRALTGLYRPLLERLGLTYPQYLVLLVLWEQTDAEPRQMTVKQLGTALRLDSGTLSPLLKRLEAAGLVTRARDPHDERSVVVGLTERGEQLRGEATGIPRAIAAATGLTSAQLRTLRDTLQALTDAANQVDSDTRSPTPPRPALEDS